MEAGKTDITGRVHSLETFGLVDGPGVRFVIFLQGCRMRCQFCHNPDTWELNRGEIWTAGKLLEKAYRYRRYWGEKGGITVSGGEPLLQLEFVSELFRLAKLKNIHTVLDTSGNSFSMEPHYLADFDRLMEYTDLFMLDLKEMDAAGHRKLTGWDNETILQMASYVSEHGKALWIRHVLVPGVTDGREDLLQLRDFLRELKTLRRVEILPYHTMGTVKWKELGIPYPLEGVRTPADEEVKEAERILETNRYH